MNILTIIVLVLIALGVYNGFKKGFLKTVLSLISWVFVLVICNVATPMATEYLIANTEIDTAIQTTIDGVISDAIAQTMESSGVTDLEATLPAELKTTMLGENGNFQDVVEGQISIDTTSLVYEIMGMIGFLVVVVVARVALMLVELVLGVVSKLPLIGPADKLLGIACGAVKGLIWCWVLLTVVAVLSLTGANTELASYVASSELLTWLQNNNILLNIIM